VTRRDKVIVWIVMPLLAVAVGIVAMFHILSMDAPSPDDADLLPQREPLPEAENAFDLFERAAGRLEGDLTEAQRHFVSDMVDDKYDAAKAEAALQAGADALALWREGLDRPGLQAPPAETIGTEIPYIYDWLSLAQLADLRALHLHRQGKDAEAMKTAMESVRFGRMVIGADACLVGYLVGVTVEGMGLARIRRMLPESRLSREALARAVEALRPKEPVGTPYAEAMRMEYVCDARLVKDLKNGVAFGEDAGIEGYEPGGRVSDFLLQVNRTKRAFARYLRPMILEASEPLAEARLPKPPPLPGIPAMAWLSVKGNVVGEILPALMLPALEGGFKIKCRRQVLITATRLLLALKAYKMETGRRPERLDVLVPACIDAVPRDGFDGDPFRYDREEGIIYSVGENLVDDGGTGRPDDQEEGRPVPPPDHVFRIRF